MLELTKVVPLSFQFFPQVKTWGGAVGSPCVPSVPGAVGTGLSVVVYSRHPCVLRTPCTGPNKHQLNGNLRLIESSNYVLPQLVTPTLHTFCTQPTHKRFTRHGILEGLPMIMVTATACELSC